MIVNLICGKQCSNHFPLIICEQTLQYDIDDDDDDIKKWYL